MQFIEQKKLSEINLNDTFFDSLRLDYSNFNEWFLKKAKLGFHAWIKTDNFNNIVAFLMLQIKKDIEQDIDPIINKSKTLKISTFKISKNVSRSKISEAFIKIIFQYAIENDIADIYVTCFKKQEILIEVFKKWGFIKHGLKNQEEVYLKSLDKHSINEPYKNYPILWKTDFLNKKVYYAIFEPEYHDKMFPEVKLKGTISKAKTFDVSSYSISKMYLFNPYRNIEPKCGDIILIYRKKSFSEPGQAFYKSVVTGIGIVEDFKKFSFGEENKIKEYVGNISVFKDQELEDNIKTNKWYSVIKFLNYITFNEGNTINYNTLKANNFLDSQSRLFNEIQNREELSNFLIKNNILDKRYIK